MSTPDTASATAADRVGELISGRYRITALLGEGGMGAVYLAEHVHMKKRLALKLLHPALAGNEEVIARFRREAEAAAHLDHPNVVAATDFGQTDDGAFFLVLEYIDGTSLREVMEGGPIPTGRALHIARQIALALGRAHEAGIVHRDLKPENVMLVRKEDDADFVKVLDFGVARIEPQTEREGSDQPLTRLGTVVGTPAYMAPEQALGEKVTARSDLYALGVVLYEMLTGKHPFDGDAMAMLSLHLVAPVPPMETRAPGVVVPAAVEALVRRLLEKDAAARPASGRELVDATYAAALESGLSLPEAAAPSSARMIVAPPASSPAIPVAPAAAPSPGATTTQSETLQKTELGATAVPRPSPFDRARATATRVLAAVMTEVDPLLTQLATASKLPRRTVTAIAVGFPVLVLIVVVVSLVLVAGGHPAAKVTPGGVVASASSEAEHKSAPTPALRAAAAKGPAALETLADEYPDDGAVLRELAFAYDGAGRTSDALRVIRRQIDAGAPVPRELVRLVMRAASKFETSEDAFTLLEGPLGVDGIDALIELSESKDIPPTTRATAVRSLAKPAVRAKATPATAVLLELSAATNCEAKREVLVRSGAQADGRALPALTALKNTRGCGSRGKHDCYRCLRGDDTLDRAIAAARDAH